jgi:hypothetical protein
MNKKSLVAVKVPDKAVVAGQNATLKAIVKRITKLEEQVRWLKRESHNY